MMVLSRSPTRRNRQSIPVAAALTSFGLTTAAVSGTYPFALAMGFKKGEAPANITTDLSTAQVIVPRRFNDGSVKHAFICGHAALTQSIARTISIAPGTQAAGTALTAGDIQDANPSSTFECEFGAVDLFDLLSSPPFRIKYQGSEMIEAHYRADIDDLLAVWFHVRLFREGRTRVRVIPENGYLDNGAGAIAANEPRTYTPVITIGGVQVFTFAPKAITNIVQNDLGGGLYNETITCPGHGLDGGLVYVSGVSGMTEINGTFVDAGPARTTDTFTTHYHVGTYSAYTSGGQVEFAHSPHQRYCGLGWIGGDPQVRPTFDRAYLKDAKFLPNYFDDVGAPDEATLDALPQTYRPLHHGGITEAMATGGFQDDIGLLPKSNALWATTGDSRAYDAVEAESSSLNSYAVCWRDATTKEIIKPSDFANWSYAGPLEGGDRTMLAGSFAYEVNHMPAEGYLAYLLTGDQWHYETLLNNVAAPWIMHGSGTGNGTSRLMTWETRGMAWNLRTMSMLAALAPDDDEVAAEYITLLEYNIDHWKSVADTPGINNLGILWTQSLEAYNPLDPGWDAPWMHYWKAMSLGFCSELDPLADMTNYIAVRDWVYKVPVGLFGANGAANYCYTRAGAYTIKIAPGADLDPTTFLGTWGDVFTATYGSANTSCGSTLEIIGDNARGDPVPQSEDTAYDPAGAATGTWSEPIAALALAVDHGAPGAQAAWDRFIAASNYSVLRGSGFNNTPQWGIEPR